MDPLSSKHTSSHPTVLRYCITEPLNSRISMHERWFQRSEWCLLKRGSSTHAGQTCIYMLWTNSGIGWGNQCSMCSREQRASLFARKALVCVCVCVVASLRDNREGGNNSRKNEKHNSKTLKSLFQWWHRRETRCESRCITDNSNPWYTTKAVEQGTITT